MVTTAMAPLTSDDHTIRVCSHHVFQKELVTKKKRVQHENKSKKEIKFDFKHTTLHYGESFYNRYC